MFFSTKSGKGNIGMPLIRPRLGKSPMVDASDSRSLIARSGRFYQLVTCAALHGWRQNLRDCMTPATISQPCLRFLRLDQLKAFSRRHLAAVTEAGKFISLHPDGQISLGQNQLSCL
ncbi:hypothetical protein CGCF415_v009168 [Colletotrichum fructicola]|uniref:Uncharacterized protein n=2 Tax=Colletotrichum gloeosporioides species complex TaxID=2707338 RepID=A0A7J6JMY8_COLFN|nr:hypothetical protein CGGC5_v000028 [Colletotrichum fructicola Nara gc5]KAF4839634.1 hypothetical protein CGCSCA4_v011119 [Colletotrichum siamense]KAF4887076.1 hypothetical protein CGCFRS4_v010739 [Colletotrichum fructicola]KAF4853854.1 hypothetical protein CGCSCA2_v009646 [Colletotrichum siamense]KAF4903174.1 hypothetical protein CGCF415_v009168 [Colletotrichum fructicola]